MSASTERPGSVVIVMGVSGCGKTTVGRALAERLTAGFLDADDFHPAVNVTKMRAGIPLEDDDRAPWLAALNRELDSRSQAGKSTVLACSALKSRYRDAITRNLERVTWIFLDGSFELIAGRLRARTGHYMPATLLRSQFELLERPENAVHVPIDLTIEEQVDAALAAVT